MTNRIVQILRENKEALADYHIKDCWIFGSAARDENSARDVDILVEFQEAPGLVQFVQLKRLLESILSKPVDLVSRKGCNDRFLRAIQRDLIHVS